MKILRILRSSIVTAATVGMLLPAPCLSAADRDPAPHLPLAQPAIVDVSLAPGSRLRGGLLDTDGNPLIDSEIVLVHRTTGRQFQTVTDQRGQFEIDELPSGLYRVETSGSSAACRCWAPATAPPAAAKELLVVADARVERGQKPLMEALYSTPTLLCLMIVAAIAIPIAVHNSNRDAS